MPSKLRKAIGAVKDKTSIGLAKVSAVSGSNIEVIILKATRHDEAPVKERYVKEILSLISSDRANAAFCAQVIAKRIRKTRTWIVALKSLMLVLRIFQDGDLHFPKEVLHASKRRARILNLSNFRDDSNSSPWDYTAFVRTFALYLDERLDCFLTGKLQKRYNKKAKEDVYIRSGKELTVFDPVILLDKFSSWQKLLDRAIATTPTGAAKEHKLINVSLLAIVHETFDLYRDISDGLVLLLDSFFSLPYQCCLNAYQVCVKAARQFEELSSFYERCRAVGVGRLSEYPSIHRIPDELIETLQEFLKDQTAFTANGKSPPRLVIPSLRDGRNRDGIPERSPEAGIETWSEKESEISSFHTSLGDLMNNGEIGRGSKEDEVSSSVESGSPGSFYLDQGTVSISNSALDLWSLDEWQSEEQKVEDEKTELPSWQKILTEAASSPQAFPDPSPDANGTEETGNFSVQFDLNSSTDVPSDPSVSFVINVEAEDRPSLPASGLHYNPFLGNMGNFHENTTETSIESVASPLVNKVKDDQASTFRAVPTFSAQNSAEIDPSGDMFAPYPSICRGLQPDGSHGNVKQEQLIWLHNQDRIISKKKVLFGKMNYRPSDNVMPL